MNINGNWMNFAYMDNPTLYTSAYLVASPQGYTKHYYAGNERIASAIGLGGLANIDTPLQLDTYHHSWEDKSNTLKDIMKRTIKDCLGNDFYCKQTLEGLYHLADPNTGTMDRYFYHPDHLGSSSWITDGSGNAIQHLHYLPFGEDWVDQRNSSWNSPYTFSGKEKDAETGYGYFGARYYDSDLSIWLSVDPMSDKYPSMSPYNYCANNPVMLVDPNGRDIFLIKGLTPEQVTLVFNTLQSLTNDKLYYVKLKDGRTQIKIEKLAKSGTEDKPCGTNLIRALNSSAKSVTIYFGTKFRQDDDIPADASNPEKGSNTTVRFDPNDTRPIDVETPTNPWTREKSILAINLAHELIHAEKAMRGVCIPNNINGRYTVPLAGKPFVMVDPLEEIMTIGLGNYKSDKYTENKIRSEWNQNRRIKF